METYRKSVSGSLPNCTGFMKPTTLRQLLSIITSLLTHLKIKMRVFTSYVVHSYPEKQMSREHFVQIKPPILTREGAGHLRNLGSVQQICGLRD